MLIVTFGQGKEATGFLGHTSITGCRASGVDVCAGAHVKVLPALDKTNAFTNLRVQLSLTGVCFMKTTNLLLNRVC